MVNSSIARKLLASIVNALIVTVVLFPFWLLGLSFNALRIPALVFFLLLSTASLMLTDNRDPGMLIARTVWAKHYSLPRRLLYSLLYTASFATLLYWLWIPGDLFLANLLFLQLPAVLLSKTTFHGWIAGMRTISA